MMVWDDRSSVGVPLLKNILTGVMGTFDEELRTWFAQNAPTVECQLVAREGDEHQSLFEGATAAACFSHHQVRLASSAACLHSTHSAYRQRCVKKSVRAEVGHVRRGRSRRKP